MRECVLPACPSVQAAKECPTLHNGENILFNDSPKQVSLTFKHGRILPTGQVEALAQQQHVEN